MTGTPLEISPELAKRLIDAGWTPPQKPAAEWALSGHDFMELAGFHAKAESEGFEYAWENYPPAFGDAELAEWAKPYAQLRELYELHADRLAEFWDSDDAHERYDAHRNPRHAAPAAQPSAPPAPPQPEPATNPQPEPASGIDLEPHIGQTIRVTGTHPIHGMASTATGRLCMENGAYVLDVITDVNPTRWAVMEVDPTSLDSVVEVPDHSVWLGESCQGAPGLEEYRELAAEVEFLRAEVLRLHGERDMAAT